MKKLSKISLGHWPTPLHFLPRLTDKLGGPSIYIKRDDLSGHALGGNKARKLEYIFANAYQQGIDTIITSGSSQSNFALQTAAAARKLGMDAYCVLVKGVHVEIQGNLLLHHILDSHIRILDVQDPSEMFTKMPKIMNELADELRNKGKTPMVITAGGENPIGTAGWVYAVEEIAQQLKEKAIHIDSIILADGGLGTQSGLILGLKYFHLPLKVIGISVLPHKKQALQEIISLTNETAALLELDVQIMPEDIIFFDDYIGEGYGIPTSGCIQAIRLVAQTEGIFLDPVYTGKAFAGLIDLIGKGYFKKDEKILFIHTGGIAANFAYYEELIKMK
ncbi:MAG: D-cysteine desulfhydrase family protein [Candidatus Atribacteria bacterium]|nr:D-cysteine desulfhydrase family protein [Candidatus Atribacteria bacterium]